MNIDQAIQEKKLHDLFTQKAELAYSIEQKIALCKAFLNKYDKKDPPEDPTGWSRIVHIPKDVLTATKALDHYYLEKTAYDKEYVKESVKRDLNIMLFNKVVENNLIVHSSTQDPLINQTVFMAKLGVFKP